MASCRWNNERKPRAIYLLAFAELRVYVGQSVDPVRRVKDHRRPGSGWAEPFQSVIVQRLHGTELEAVDLEYAWRWCAHINGWVPIDSKGMAFDLASFRESARHKGQGLPWPFTT